MRHETVAIFCCFVAAIAVFVVDFDAANERWCKTYPELCEPVDVDQDTRTEEII